MTAETTELFNNAFTVHKLTGYTALRTWISIIDFEDRTIVNNCSNTFAIGGDGILFGVCICVITGIANVCGKRRTVVDDCSNTFAIGGDGIVFGVCISVVTGIANVGGKRRTVVGDCSNTFAIGGDGILFG